MSDAVQQEQCYAQVTSNALWDRPAEIAESCRRLLENLVPEHCNRGEAGHPDEIRAVLLNRHLGAALLRTAATDTDFDAAFAAFTRSLDLADAAGDLDGWCRMQRCLGLVHACRSIGRVDAAEHMQAAIEAFEVASSAGQGPFDLLGWIALRTDLAALHLRVGTPAAATVARATVEALLYDPRLDWEPVARQEVEDLLVESLRLGARNDAEVARALIHATEAAHGQRRYEDAEPVYRHAAELLRGQLGEGDAEYRALLHNLRYMWEAQGNIQDAAINAFDAERESALDGQAQAELVYARRVERFVELYVEAHDYTSAAHLLPELLNSSRRQLDGTSTEYVRHLDLSGWIYAQAGHYASAYRAWYEALRILDSQTSENAEEMRGQIAGELGELLCKRFENLREAGPWLQRSLDAYQALTGEHHLHVAVAHRRLATFHRMSGNLDQARDQMRRATAITAADDDADGPDTAHLTECALLAEASGDDADAWRLSDEVYRQDIERYGTEHPRAASALELLGHVHQRSGDSDTARRCYEECLRVRGATLGEHHRDLTAVQRKLAAIAVQQHRVDDAITLMRAVVHSDSRYFGELLSVGSARYRMDALDRMRSHADMLFTLATRYVDLADHDARYLEGLRLHLAMMEESGRGFSVRMETLSLILYNVTLRRKGLGAQLERLHRFTWRDLGGRSERLDALLRRLTAVRSDLARRALAPVGGTAAEISDASDDLIAEKERLETELSASTPPHRLDLIMEHEDVGSVMGGLPAGSVLIDYVQFQPFDFEHGFRRGVPTPEPARYLAFIVRARFLSCDVVDLGQVVEIDAAVADFRRRIRLKEAGRDLGMDEQDENLTGVDKVGFKLRSLVFDPLLAKLQGSTRILICPDGELSSIPFEALPLDDGGNLIDTYRISYLVTGRDAVRFGTPSGHGPSTEPLVIGDPDYDLSLSAAGGASRNEGPAPSRAGQPGFRFRPLAGAKEEAGVVGELLGVEPLIGARALKSQLKQHRGPRVLHLATHGFLLAADGAGVGNSRKLPLLRAGLALAGANTTLDGAIAEGADDGILTAEEVLDMDLLGTELAVLSACDTGLGEARIGEGILGLRHAVAAAGAWSLLISLWKVPDAETNELMICFYDRLLAGAERVDALRDAQMAVRKRHPEPIYWAGFICQGLPGGMRLRPVEGAAGPDKPGLQTEQPTGGEAATPTADVALPQADRVDIDRVIQQVNPNSWLSPRERADLCVCTLAHLDRDEKPGVWLLLQYKLGLNSQKAKEGDPEENRQRTIAAYRAALGACTRDSFPFWPYMQIGLATALHKGRGGDAEPELQEAIAAARAALGAFAKDAAPREWANAQLIIGDCSLALCTRGTSGRRELDKTLAAYKRTLEVFTREQHPVQWRWCRLRLSRAERQCTLGRPPDRFDPPLRGLELTLGF